MVFEADVPFARFVRCHCFRCRNASGSAFAVNAYVLPAAFRWITGEEAVVRFDLSQARSFSTAFCRHCGSPLPHATRSGREIIIPAGSLRDDPGEATMLEAHRESRAGWISGVTSLPTADQV